MARIKAREIDRVRQWALLEFATFGAALHELRALERQSLDEFSKRLGISITHLQDVEKDRRPVSVKRAVQWATLLAVPVHSFVRLVLQRKADDAGAAVRVIVEAHDAA